MVVIGIGLVVLLVAFSETVASAVYQWNTSSAYNYGYLIAPISAYLLWTQREAIAVWRPAPTWLGLVPCLGFAGVWLVGDVMGVDEGRQFALVGMMQGLFLTVLGWPLFRRIAFPLQYLWLQVPTGEFLLPLLQTLSHTVAVEMLRLSGMSVFAEGFLIQVPSGNFLVEPGCAGLNFLLASIALALLYGKLTYRRWSTRLICLAVAVIASILANFVRVYLIVAITEWSDRRINIADDHLFYGWVFFGIIMMVMMWWGMTYRDVVDDRPKPENERPTPVAPHRISVEVRAAVGAIVIFLLPIAFSAVTASADSQGAPLNMPPRIGDWSRSTSAPEWSPATADGDAAMTVQYLRGSTAIDFSVTAYAAQVDGREAASAENGPAPATRFETVSRGSAEVSIGPSKTRVATAVIRSSAGPRLVAHWYVSSGCITASRVTAKLCAARDRLMARASPGAFMAVSLPMHSDPAATIADIESFTAALRLGELLPSSVTP